MPKFSLKSRLLSFKYAFKGLGILLKEEHNVLIHLGFAITSIFGGWYFNISIVEWMMIISCIGMVIMAEIFNTSIEHIANYIQPNQDTKIEIIKDLGAAGVFIAALSAFLIGVIIFIPKIMDLL
ncbi:MAG: diacylglycerol kinase family protein [Saprospiraceae bacterium]